MIYINEITKVIKQQKRLLKLNSVNYNKESYENTTDNRERKKTN
jgi:hypothetical protein